MQTIYIPTSDNVPSASPASQNFYIELLNPSLNVSTASAPTGVGVTATNNPTTGFAATVTILNTIQVSPAITSATSTSPGTSSPPDPAGAEGNGDIAVMVNGLFNVYSTSGQLLLSESTTAFWTSAGQTPKGTPTSSRILYDPTTDRWIAVALDTNIVAGVEQAGNNVLIAVSDSASPTGTWTAFAQATTTVTSGAVAATAYGTSVALGLDQLAANITVDLSTLSESLISIPTAVLFPAVATTAPADTGLTAIGGVTNPSVSGVSELSLQPTTDLSGSEPTNVLIGIDENIANTIDRFDIAGEATKATVAGPTPISVSPATITNPSSATQPVTAKLGTPFAINTGTDVFPTTLYQVGNDIWAVQTVPRRHDEPFRHPMVRDQLHERHDPAARSDQLSQCELLRSVDRGQRVRHVVIGFSGSGTNQFVSAYAVMGTTTGGATTFGTPILLQQGTGEYGSSGVNPWGNYSETVVDGDNPTSTFWTFQEVATGTNQWSVEAFKVTFATPTVSQPTVTLTPLTGSLNYNGGTATVTVSLPSNATATTTIDLAFAGTAVANVDYSIAAGTNAVITAGQPVQIVIPAGQSSGTVTLTGLDSASQTTDLSIVVTATEINNATLSLQPSSTLSLIDSASPEITIQNQTVNDTLPLTAEVVIQLSNPVATPITLTYSTGTGTAIAGTDYTAVTNQSLTIPADAQTIDIPITILGDTAAASGRTFTVVLSSPSRGLFPGNATTTSATITLVDQPPQLSIEDTTLSNATSGTAEVFVQLSEEVSVPVTVEYITAVDLTPPAGTSQAPAGTAYVPVTSPQTITIPAGQPGVDIPINIIGQSTHGAEAFLVQLVSSSSPASPSFGTLARSTATVTLVSSQPGSTLPASFDSGQSNTNFTADTSASGPFEPASPSAAVGNNEIVLFDNDTYNVYAESGGTLLSTSTLNSFWNTALGGTGLPSGDQVFDAHVVFNPTTDLWYASAIDWGNPANPTSPANLPNNFLVAVSKTSDPTQGWTAFIVSSNYPAATPTSRADFDTLGFNSNSLVVTANMYDLTTGTSLLDRAVLSIPLTDVTPTTTPTTFDNNLTLDYTLSTTGANSTFDAALDYDSTPNETLLAQSTDGKSLLVQTITGGGARRDGGPGRSDHPIDAGHRTDRRPAAGRRSQHPGRRTGWPRRPLQRHDRAGRRRAVGRPDGARHGDQHRRHRLVRDQRELGHADHHSAGPNQRSQRVLLLPLGLGQQRGERGHRLQRFGRHAADQQLRRLRHDEHPGRHHLQ